jgi:hypothetical protein
MLYKLPLPLILRRQMRECDRDFLIMKLPDMTELRIIFIEERHLEIADYSYPFINERWLRAA